MAGVLVFCELKEGKLKKASREALSIVAWLGSFTVNAPVGTRTTSFSVSVTLPAGLPASYHSWSAPVVGAPSASCTDATSPSIQLSTSMSWIECSISVPPPARPRSRRHVEPYIVRYEHEPRRATQMIEDLGYRKGPDGMFQDAAGKPLSIQIMATQDDTSVNQTRSNTGHATTTDTDTVSSAGNSSTRSASARSSSTTSARAASAARPGS